MRPRGTLNTLNFKKKRDVTQLKENERGSGAIILMFNILS